MTDQISVRVLTTELEKSDNHNIQPFFSGKFEEERFKDLDAIRELTDALDAGNGKALEAVLAGKYQEERASILNQMGALITADLADHKSDISLQISVSGPKHNAGTMSVIRQLNTNHDWWMGGWQLYAETLDFDNDKRQIQSLNDLRK